MTNQLESRMRAVGNALRAHQVAWLFKVPEEMQQTPCDFFGFTVKGRAVLVECKQVAGTALKVAGSPGLLGHQWCALEDAHRAGAISLIAWARGDEVAILPFLEAQTLAAGRRSIPWSAIGASYRHVFDHVGLYAAMEDQLS